MIPAQSIFDEYIAVAQKLNLPLWPDIMVSQLRSQAELSRWISYELKPMPFHRWYNEGVARGCDLEQLNLLFDETLFQGITCAFGRMRSPRKIGNLHCEAPTYIGRRPHKRLTKKQMNAWRLDKQLQAEHPEWLETIVAEANKREMRRGHTRYRNDQDRIQAALLEETA